MIIVGVNSSHTKSKKPLKDGSCAIIQDGIIVGALSEERIVRYKHAGGYIAAFHHLLKSFDITVNQIDLVVSSTCCENEEYAVNGLSPLLLRYPEIEIATCNHHLSHAYSCYYTSPFQNSIIIVIDAGGNTYDNDNGQEWWKSKREQHSYYSGIDGRVDLIGRDFLDPEATGIGELYRAFTHYAGWPSSTYAGNLMALAGCKTTLEPITSKPLIQLKQNTLSSNIPCSPTSPVNLALSILSNNNIDPPHRIDTDHPSDASINIAKWVQSEIEESLKILVNRLVSETGIKNICFAGGVAYNCKALGNLLKSSKAERIFIFPAAGDHGQALGNAIYGYTKKTNSYPHYSFSPFLGPTYPTNFTKIKDLITHLQLPLNVSESNNIASDAAGFLANAEILGWYQGRSEYGPRALGNRSILASPTANDIKHKLNKIKNRAYYMPLAPVVLKDQASNFFEEGGNAFMSIAVDAKVTNTPWIGNVTHEDCTARVQVVEKENNSLFYEVISNFNRLTNIPILLNTSFNAGGHPIVETVSDALETFSELPLDRLIIGNVIVTKSSVASNRIDLIFKDKPDTSIEISEIVDTLIQLVPSGTKFKKRNRFLLYQEYVEWVKIGRKCTTIRYVKNSIDIPSNKSLPLLSTDDYGQQYVSFVGKAIISSVTVKYFGKLDEIDAINDGFDSLEQLKKVLQDIYGIIGSSEYVTIYNFYLTDIV